MEGAEDASKALPDELEEKIVAMMPFPSILKARLLSKSWSGRIDDRGSVLSAGGSREMVRSAAIDEAEDMYSTLPDELVEKIVAMMPFPSIFKARLLSKSWNARFEPISLLEDEDEKRLAKLFHKRVAEWSSNWDTFCCVGMTISGRLIAFTQVTQRWQRLPSFYWLPEDLYSAALYLGGPFWATAPKHLQLEGPLFYGTWQISGYMQEMHVGNILTREWKELPPRPEEDLTTVHCMKLVIDTSSETYKVIVFCDLAGDDDQYHYCGQVYDSRSGTWSSTVFVFSQDIDLDYSPVGHAYLNGVFYMVTIKNPMGLLAFKVDDGSLEELRMSIDGEIDLDNVKLEVFNGTLLMLVVDSDSENVRVLKLDLAALRLIEVARYTEGSILDPMDTRDMENVPVSEVNSMLFETQDFDDPILTYNKQKDEWRFFSFPMGQYDSRECSFQPGLNPFLAV